MTPGSRGRVLLVDDEPALLEIMAETLQEAGFAGDRAAGALERLDEHGGQIAGVGLDRAFALHSTIVTADAFAERFLGLYPVPDWTAEVGLRRQVTPLVVLDVGIARHFAGVIHSHERRGFALFDFCEGRGR